MSKCEKCAKYPCNYIITFNMDEEVGCVEFIDKRYEIRYETATINNIQEKNKGEINMKGTEALKELKQEHIADCNELMKDFSVFNKVRYETIEKELKALEIICNSYDVYGIIKDNKHYLCIGEYQHFISKKQYDLLKEVLK